MAPPSVDALRAWRRSRRELVFAWQMGEATMELPGLSSPGARAVSPLEPCPCLAHNSAMGSRPRSPPSLLRLSTQVPSTTCRVHLLRPRSSPSTQPGAGSPATPSSLAASALTRCASVRIATSASCSDISRRGRSKRCQVQSVALVAIAPLTTSACSGCSHEARRYASP